MAQQLGHFQRASNKLKQFAIDHQVPNAGQIELNGLLDDQWEAALRAILQDADARMQLDYGLIREIRDDPALGLRGFRFVGSIGEGFPGHREFLKMIGARASEEAEGKPPTSLQVLFNRACGWPEHW